MLFLNSSWRVPQGQRSCQRWRQGCKRRGSATQASPVNKGLLHSSWNQNRKNHNFQFELHVHSLFNICHQNAKYSKLQHTAKYCWQPSSRRWWRQLQTYLQENHQKLQRQRCGGEQSSKWWAGFQTFLLLYKIAIVINMIKSSTAATEWLWTHWIQWPSLWFSTGVGSDHPNLPPC